MIKNPIPWPNGAKCAACVTFDMDADSLIHVAHKQDGFSRVGALSMLRYGPQVGVPRIVETYKELGLKQTFFVPAWCIESYPEAVEAMLSGGNEVAHHSYIHEHPSELPPSEEEYWMDRAIDVIKSVTGQHPRGFRAPLYNFSDRTAGLLAERGFTYDASLMGDDIPYFLDTDKGSLVELPTHWGLDDWPQYVQSIDLDYMMPIRAPQQGFETFRQEFESAYRNGGLWIPVMHPFATGRMSRWEVVSAFLKEVLERGDVWFAPMEEIAAHVAKVTADGSYMPRRDNLPYYTGPVSPIPPS